MKNNIKIKTFTYLLLFSIAILLLLWVVQIQFLGLFYERYQMENIKTVANKIVNNESDNFTLENYAYENNMCIQIITPNETINYNTKNPGCFLTSNNKKIQKYKSDLILKGNKYIKLYSPLTNKKSILYAINLNNKIIFLNTTLEDLNTTTTLLKSQLIYIVIILIVLSVAISIVISNMLNKPLLNIINKSKNLGKEDVRFDKTNIAELDELCDVLTVASSEMNKTDKLRQDLLANVSHDLKTPLTMIKAYAEKVKDYKYSSKEDKNKDLEIIINETDRLNNLVNDILDLSKIENDKTDLKLEKYDLVANIKSIIERYDIYIKEDKFDIKVDLPEHAYVYADKSKIEQVIYNLINNAIEHTGEDKYVGISVKKKKDDYVVSITNTGHGIEESEKSLVWTRYYKKEKNHKRNIVGTGLGLSIVKEILDKHNCSYGIDSVIDDHTTFYFKLKKIK